MVHNDWLKGAYVSSDLYRVLLYDYESEIDSHLESIRRFEGSKVFVPYSPGIRLSEIIPKLVLSFDLIILCSSQPPPICGEEPNWAEFAYPCFLDNADVSVGMQWAHATQRYIHNHSSLFRECAITVLPILGGGGFWTDEFARYQDGFIDLSTVMRSTVVDEGIIEYSQLVGAVALINERIFAESLGAIHLNPVSTNRPILNDLKRNPLSAFKTQHLVPFDLVSLNDLPDKELLEIRKDTKHFRSSLFNKLNSINDSRGITSNIIDDIFLNELKVDSEQYTKDLRQLVSRSKTLTARVVLKSSICVLAAAGYLASAKTAVEFLAGGSILNDFWDLVSVAYGVETKTRRDSIFYGLSKRCRRSTTKKTQRTKSDDDPDFSNVKTWDDMLGFKQFE